MEIVLTWVFFHHSDISVLSIKLGGFEAIQIHYVLHKKLLILKPLRSGEGVKNCQFYFVKRRLRGERGSKISDFET